MQSTQPILPIGPNNFLNYFFNFSIRDLYLPIGLRMTRSSNSMMDSIFFQKGMKLIIIKVFPPINNKFPRTSKSIRDDFLNELKKYFMIISSFRNSFYLPRKIIHDHMNILVSIRHRKWTHEIKNPINKKFLPQRLIGVTCRLSSSHSWLLGISHKHDNTQMHILTI